MEKFFKFNDKEPPDTICNLIQWKRQWLSLTVFKNSDFPSFYII